MNTRQIIELLQQETDCTGTNADLVELLTGLTTDEFIELAAALRKECRLDAGILPTPQVIKHLLQMFCAGAIPSNHHSTRSLTRPN